MQKRMYILSVILLTSLSTFSQNPEATQQIIFKLKTELPAADLSSTNPLSIGNAKVDYITQKYHALRINKMPAGRKTNRYIYVVTFPNESDLQPILVDYTHTNEIEYAEPNYIATLGGVQGVVPNDQYYPRQWGLKNDGSFSLSVAVSGADIDMENAWEIERGDSTIVVGVIDTGNKLDHPEFAGRIWMNYNEISGNGIDDDNNGYVDDVQGWDFAYADNDATDDLGHGTNVTGIIGAHADNATGYAGVDWNCKLMILKSIDDNNNGEYVWLADAIYYAVDNGARVINMSVGGTSYSITLDEAVQYATANNVTVVACMMNTNTSTVYYPAGYEGVIAVGSTNANDKRSRPFFWGTSSGSNYGNHISVVAPGNYIYGLDYESNSNYNSYWGGTSQATPLVSGLVSLLLAQNPNRTPAELKSIIEGSAEDMVGAQNEDTPGWDKYFGHGRINAFYALSASAGIQPSASENEMISLYPNPSAENVVVNFPTTATQMQVFNSVGQLIQTLNVKGQTQQNIQLTESGLYYIQISTDKGTVTKKLIVCK